MSVVRYFAAAEEASGCEQESRSEASLGDLRAGLVRDHPALAAILPRCAVLVGGVRVDDATLLSATDVIDVLPPFAGG